MFGVETTISRDGMHIPQELRIRSVGTERHSASNNVSIFLNLLNTAFNGRIRGIRCGCRQSQANLQVTVCPWIYWV